MARIRSIKPEFWTSEQIMGLNPLTRLLFIGMWNFADDYGRMPYAPATIKAQILPGDTLELQLIRNMLAELSSAGLILLYTAKGREYLEITGWCHQKIDKPHKPKHPSPVIDEPETIDEQEQTVAEPSPNIPRTLAVGEDRIGEDNSRVVEGARASEGTISSAAFSLADKFLEAIGADREAPEWQGVPYRADLWLRHGWTEPIVSAASRKVMAGRIDIPNIKYFEKAIARAFADQNAPVPVAQPGGRHESTGRNSGTVAGWQSARDDFRTARQDLKRALAAAEGEGDECSEGGGPPIRLIAPAGRG
jgi:hypothetical protein